MKSEYSMFFIGIILPFIILLMIAAPFIALGNEGIDPPKKLRVLKYSINGSTFNHISEKEWVDSGANIKRTITKNENASGTKYIINTVISKGDFERVLNDVVDRNEDIDITVKDQDASLAAIIKTMFNYVTYDEIEGE